MTGLTMKSFNGDTAVLLYSQLSPFECGNRRQVNQKSLVGGKRTALGLICKFREDAISLDPDGAAQVALFNRIALNVIKQNTSIKDSQAAKHQRATWSVEFYSQPIFD
ncbi:hypothetical protein XNC3_2710003 [Xenorhabdus nematophila F1]|nr:hypothetical protein XNC3_2710003 [Xenorhabdus nematophila F1]